MRKVHRIMKIDAGYLIKMDYRGRIQIPKEIMNALGWRAGVLLTLESQSNGTISVRPHPSEEHHGK